MGYNYQDRHRRKKTYEDVLADFSAHFVDSLGSGKNWTSGQWRAFRKLTEHGNYTFEELEKALDSWMSESNYKPTPKNIAEYLPKRKKNKEIVCKACEDKGAVVIYSEIAQKRYPTPCLCEAGKRFKEYLRGYTSKIESEHPSSQEEKQFHKRIDTELNMKLRDMFRERKTA